MKAYQELERKSKDRLEKSVKSVVWTEITSRTDCYNREFTKPRRDPEENVD